MNAEPSILRPNTRESTSERSPNTTQAQWQPAGLHRRGIRILLVYLDNPRRGTIPTICRLFLTADQACEAHFDTSSPLLPPQQVRRPWRRCWTNDRPTREPSEHCCTFELCLFPWSCPEVEGQAIRRRLPPISLQCKECHVQRLVAMVDLLIVEQRCERGEENGTTSG